MLFRFRLTDVAREGLDGKGIGHLPGGIELHDDSTSYYIKGGEHGISCECKTGFFSDWTGFPLLVF